jgi:hypothetical protein
MLDRTRSLAAINHRKPSIRAILLTQVPLKYTSNTLVPKARVDGENITFDSMFLHGRNLFQGKTKAIYHKQCFGYVNLRGFV